MCGTDVAQKQVLWGGFETLTPRRSLVLGRLGEWTVFTMWRETGISETRIRLDGF